jgi:hypothetical protein
MVLTSDDFTLQLGGMEAIAVGKPILVSDYPFLREYFFCGAVYTPNTVAGIRQSMIRLKKDIVRLSGEIPVLQQAHQKEWEMKSRQLFDERHLN